MELQTEQVSLRLLTQEDAEAMHALRNDNRLFLEPFEPIQSDESFTLEAVKQTIRQYLIEQQQDLSYSFGIFHRQDGELVGRLRLSSIVRGAWHNANLGYFMAERACGRGSMTDAVGLALRFAFGEARLHRVQAAIMPRNVPSIRVIEKNGMRLEGLARRYLNIVLNLLHCGHSC